jgi:hypothetical protein
MSEKIRREHLQRGAYVYVRQSTPYQVRNHLEGKERQYALAERAKQLGFSKVIVIDEDLGRSGSGAQERLGSVVCWPQFAKAWQARYSRWKLRGWPAIIETGTIWLICVHWQKRYSSTPMESMTRAH